LPWLMILKEKRRSSTLASDPFGQITSRALLAASA
jgi:hypothetical protein